MNDLVASELADLRRRVAILEGLEIAQSQIGCRVYNSANISINSGIGTALTFNSERWDTDSIHSTSSNTSRLTCQTAGHYLIHFTGGWDANATGIRQFYFMLNGTTPIASLDITNNGAGAQTHLTLSTEYQLAVGDYVEVYASQSSGGALNVVAAGNYSPEFGMWRLP